MDKAQQRIRKHIESLASADAAVSSRAEGYLLRYYNSRAVESLIESCSHANPRVRFRSAWVLGYSHDPRAYDTILRLTKDPDGFVRYDAAIALGILGDECAIKPLIALMRQPDDEHSVDSAAAMGLVRLGSCCVPALIDLLHHGSTKDHNKVALVLGGIGDRSATEPLAALLSSPNPDTRIAAIEALSDMGGDRCLELIRTVLDDADQQVQENAAHWVRDLEAASNE